MIVRTHFLATLLDATYRIVWRIVQALTHNPTSGETFFKSTYVCFPPTYSYMITLVGLSGDLLSSKVLNIGLLSHKWPQYKGICCGRYRFSLF